MSHEKIRKLAVKFRFLRIPVKWSIKTNDRGEPTAVPHMPDQRNVVMSEIDGWKLRDDFLRLKDGDGRAALRFLQQVGLWGVKDTRWTRWTYGYPDAEEPGEFFNGYFGSRLLQGEALSVSKSHLQKLAGWWNEALRDRSTLRKEIGSPPPEAKDEMAKYLHAWKTSVLNELPMHIEWQGSRAFAVIETVTGQEMLTATIHLDLLRGAKFGNCSRKDCGIAFPRLSKHKKKYCSTRCAHLVAVRKSRKRKDRAKKDGGDDGGF